MKKNDSRISTGKVGEDLAADYLIHHGCQIIARNYRKRLGEIDIIARDGEYLVFVEVKTRRGARYGSPFDAVNWRKQQQISKVALAYMIQYNLMDTAVRFDVVGVYLSDAAPKVEQIQNAFEYCG